METQIEADHGAIKRRIRSMLGFKSAKTAYATLKGIEAMRMIRKLQCILLKPGVAAENPLLQQALRHLFLMKAICNRARAGPLFVFTQDIPVGSIFASGLFQT